MQNGTAIIGDSSKTVSTSSPTITSIQGQSNYWGLVNYGTTYFYNGSISGNLAAIWSSGTLTPRSGYSILRNNSGGVEKATLVESVAKIGSTYYATLQEAFNESSQSSGTRTEIILLKNITESPTLASDHYANLRLNSYTVSNTTSTATITNNGNLTITGSGTVSSSGGYAINNIGTLTLSSNPTIKTSASSKAAIYNTKEVTAGSGTISSTHTSTSGNAIENASTSATLTISGATLLSTSGDVVSNLGNITMSSGKIETKAQKDGISIKSGNLTITDGTIETVGWGINTNGSKNACKITIGANDSTVSKTSPVICGDTFAITTYNSTQANVYFYDGILRSNYENASFNSNSTVYPLLSNNTQFHVLNNYKVVFSKNGEYMDGTLQK